MPEKNVFPVLDKYKLVSAENSLVGIKHGLELIKSSYPNDVDLNSMLDSVLNMIDTHERTCIQLEDAAERSMEAGS